MTAAVDAALRRAFEDAARPAFGVRAGGAFSRRLAVGDPQAPLERFLSLLDRRGLLGADGRLLPHVQLVSLGDHFDWGRAGERRRAGAESRALFAWLCAHRADQVVVLLGNHDLARVCELHGWTAAAFDEALAEAMAAYREGAVDEAAQARFLARYPVFPAVEIVARDYASFEPAQAALVEAAIRAGRVRLAQAEDARTLLVHAGVNGGQLRALGVDEGADACAVGRALNAFLRGRAAAWEAGPLDLTPLHVPGSAAEGEGTGMFFHRAAHPTRFEGPPGRKFDPRELPRGFTQIVGHVKDGKCRALLGPWAADEPEEDGPLRQLTVLGGEVRYARGLRAVPEGAAAMIFCDGGMIRTPPERYELFDLDTRTAA